MEEQRRESASSWLPYRLFKKTRDDIADADARLELLKNQVNVSILIENRLGFTRTIGGGGRDHQKDQRDFVCG